MSGRLNFCENCGSPLRPGVRYCGNCGQSLSEPSPPPPSLDATQTGASLPTPTRPAEVSRRAARPLWLWGIAAVILMGGLVLGGAAILRLGVSPPPPTATVAVLAALPAEPGATPTSDAVATAAALQTALVDVQAAASADAAALIATQTAEAATAEAIAAGATNVAKTSTARAAATSSARAVVQTVAARAATVALVRAQETVAAGSTVTASAGATATALPPASTPVPTLPVSSPSPAGTPRGAAKTGAILDFETGMTWRRGDQLWGELDRATDRAAKGVYAGRIRYDFPAVKDNYVVFLAQPPIQVPGQPLGLSGLIYGDAAGHFLNVWIRDAAGEVRQYTFGQITHQGWRQSTAWFDDRLGWPNGHISGQDNGKLDYPVSFYALVLDAVPDGQASAGSIYLDEVGVAQGSIPDEAAAATPVMGPGPTPAPTARIGGLRGRIVFPVFDGQRGIYDVYVAGVDGSNMQRAIDAASQPAFSPDGGRLAIRRWQHDDRGLEILDASGNNRHRHTSFLEDGLPAWAPDGKQLVFFSRREPDRQARIYLLDLADGSDRALRRGLDPVFGEFPSWLPDGRIIYRVTAPQLGLALMNADASGYVMIVADGSATAPAVSPDGRHIAFMSSRDGNWEIYRAGVDGSHPERLTAGGAADGLPAWSPDGSSLAFVSDRGGAWAIWAMNADGSGQTRLFALPGPIEGYVANEPGYTARGWLEERISWAP